MRSGGSLGAASGMGDGIEFLGDTLHQWIFLKRLALRMEK